MCVCLFGGIGVTACWGYIGRMIWLLCGVFGELANIYDYGVGVRVRYFGEMKTECRVVSLSGQWRGDVAVI